MITIKEYATSNGVTPQSVYKKLNSKKLKDRLKGHVVIEYGVKCLDDVAVQILEENKRASTNTLSIVKNNENKEELNKLRDENTRLKDELIAKQNKYESVLEQLLVTKSQLADVEKQLLEYQIPDPRNDLNSEGTKENKTSEPERKRRNWFTRLFKKY